MDTTTLIQHLRREGKNWSQIADHLNATRVPTRYSGSRWWPGTVQILAEGRKGDPPKDQKLRRDSFIAVMAERARGTESRNLAGALAFSNPELGPWTDITVAHSLIYPTDAPRLSRFRVARFLLEVYRDHQGLSYQSIGAQLAHMRLWGARTSAAFVEGYHKELKPLTDRDIYADIKSTLRFQLTPAELLAEFQRAFPADEWTAAKLAML